MDEELFDVLDEEEKLSGQKEKEQIMSAMESSQLSLQNKEVGKQLYRDHTAPKPVFHGEYLQNFKKDENYKAQNKHNHLLSLGSGYYTKEMFGDMKPIDNDFGKYVIGGEPVTQDEYCGLVAGCSMMPKYAYEAYKKSPEFDATALETYKNLGYSEEDAKEILSNYSATMVVTDHMKGDLRNSQGNVFKNTISPAREEVFRVLEEYKNGNKEPLAKAIKRGIEAYKSLWRQQYVYMDGHDELAPGVYVTRYANGTKVYVNYTKLPFALAADGVAIPAEDWMVK